MGIKRNILLNPGPATTTDSVKRAQLVPDICPRESEFVQLMEALQKDLIKIVHGGEDKYASVLFCGSGTICMDVCLNSLLPADGKILIVNNGAYSARGAEICDFYGLPYIDLHFPSEERPNLEAVENALKDDKDIRILYTTHNETGTGVLNPIREIGEIAHKYHCIYVVDTTSTYAMIPIDLEEDHIDFCMASAQKGLMAMTGLSFVIGKRELIEQSRNNPKRSYYCNLYAQYENFEKRKEMRFTPPVQTIYAAKKAIEEYFEEGEKAKWERHKRITKAIHGGLKKLGFQECIKQEWQSSLVVSVLYPKDRNWKFEHVHNYCYERGYTIYPGKISGMATFRLCSLGAIHEGDIENFFIVFEEALRVNQIKVPVGYED